MDIVTEKKCNVCGETKPIDGFPKRGAKCKSCTYKQQKEWGAKNKDKLSETYKRYARNHPEKMKEKGKRKYALLGDLFRNTIKAWRENNQDKLKESQRNWWSKNTLKRAQYNKTQREKHPDKVRMNNEKRRARLKNAQGTITAKEWSDLLYRYGNRCLCCKSKDVKLTLDHVIPIALGGTHTIDNAQPLCASCNSRKGARHIDYR